MSQEPNENIFTTQMQLQLHKNATRYTPTPGTHKYPISITSNLSGTMKSKDTTPTQMSKQYPNESKHIGYRPAIKEFPAAVQSVTSNNNFHKNPVSPQVRCHQIQSYDNPYM